jgi:hypothetical protein
MVKTVKFLKERIDLLIKYQNVSEVARQLNVNVSPLNRYFKRCIKEGTIKLENNTFEKGQNYSGHQSERSNKNGQIAELHGTRIVIPLINPSDNWKQNKEIFLKFDSFQLQLDSYKPNEQISPRQVMYDFKDIQVFHITTTSKSIILVQKKDEQLQLPLSREAPMLLKEKLMTLVFQLIPILERRFMEKLSNQFETEIYLTRQHYAFLKNPIANEFVKNRMALKVFGKEDNKLRTVVDVSKGIIHFENVHDREAPLDAEAHARFIGNINSGNFNEEKVVDEVDTLKGSNNMVLESLNVQVKVNEGIQNNQKGIQENQIVFDKNMVSHISAVQQLAQGVSILNETVTELKKTVKELSFGFSNHINQQNTLVQVQKDITCLTDFFNPNLRDRINSLSLEDKKELDQWIFNKFGGY